MEPLTYESKTVHDVKCWPEYFRFMISGLKKFDVRKDDRHYMTGDKLLEREWDPSTKEYTGNKALFEITYILEGGKFGLEPGYVCMGIEPVRWTYGQI